jgi:hypothetical protein
MGKVLNIDLMCGASYKFLDSCGDTEAMSVLYAPFEEM